MWKGALARWPSSLICHRGARAGRGSNSTPLVHHRRHGLIGASRERNDATSSPAIVAREEAVLDLHPTSAVASEELGGAGVGPGVLAAARAQLAEAIHNDEEVQGKEAIVPGGASEGGDGGDGDGGWMEGGVDDDDDGVAEGLTRWMWRLE
ncbi:hypothetical protein PR202_gb18256 [Eleusine coracana subsp. coracana]|uniref:Uncharacterized protein n=1 Tax=Eleusine coracana subsp. coracana TaxID=191504 RepID=A0AAV5F2T5_ELECO|nr:hypothetical protein PR202_gb18256 [Eleusine coracana subsp. coracana]